MWLVTHLVQEAKFTEMRGNGVPENYGAGEHGEWISQSQKFLGLHAVKVCFGAGAVLYYRGKFYPIWES